jgi:hypothetical protein
MLRLIPPNPIYGLPTKRMNSQPEVWYLVNSFGGRMLVVAPGRSRLQGAALRAPQIGPSGAPGMAGPRLAPSRWRAVGAKSRIWAAPNREPGGIASPRATTKPWGR